jgi:kinetochore protein Spc24
MLLSEDPSTLINHTINNFNINPDKLAVARINESISTLQQARDLRLREAEGALKKLSRTLTTMNSQHEELVATHSSSSHAAEIARLDTQKFRTAKAASDAEMDVERLAQQLADLQARLAELEAQGDEGAPAAASAARGPDGEIADSVLDDEVLLRLKVYRSLGIDVEREAGSGGAIGEGAGEGEFTKAVIRNDRKGDVHVVNIDKKFSRFFYANYFWGSV